MWTRSYFRCAVRLILNIWKPFSHSLISECLDILRLALSCRLSQGQVKRNTLCTHTVCTGYEKNTLWTGTFKNCVLFLIRRTSERSLFQFLSCLLSPEIFFRFLKKKKRRSSSKLSQHLEKLLKTFLFQGDSEKHFHHKTNSKVSFQNSSRMRSFSKPSTLLKMLLQTVSLHIKEKLLKMVSLPEQAAP